MSQPYTLYLMWISYFSGKMQAYLRYKEVPHACVEPKWREILDVLYVGSSRVDLQACKLEYSIVSPK